MRNSAKLATGVVMMLGVAIGAQGCSSAPVDDSDDSEGAATAAGTINVSNAKVAICDDEVGGCPKCDEKIGDYTLTADEREACTLKLMRGGLKDRINLLISLVGRNGFFLRAADQSSFRLARIKVVPATGENENAKSQYTKLSGSFTTGADGTGSGVKGGVSVYSVFTPVKIVFEFEDKTGGTIARQDVYSMRNTYKLTPFFYMKADLAVNLSVGGILSKFGGGPVASSLLSALGGNASLHVDAAHEVRWTTPVCADSTDDKDKNSTTLRTFDNDFLKNVLLPACLQYKKDNSADVNCELDPKSTYDTQTLLERDAALSDRKVLPLHACKVLDAPWLSTNTYEVSFAAPKAWGYSAGADAFLYKANANASDVWQRQTAISVIGVDGVKGEACGVAKLGEAEVCVHAKLKTALFASDCAAIQASGPRSFGIVQTTDDADQATIQYKLPAP